MSRPTQDRRAGIDIPPDSVIAIDGPAGSGKSTTAREVAQRLGLLYIDTGAMYRALTLAALAAGIAPQDAGALEDLLSRSELALAPDRQGTRVRWNGRDVTQEIRAAEVEQHVSAVSSHAGVRRLMVARQRALGRDRGVVMEGRDIGTVVFPLATAKIYLDASLEARARRRLRQQRQLGRQDADLATLIAEMETRDRLDRERSESPLQIAPDAVVIDNSELTVAEQVDRVLAAVGRVVADKTPRPSPPDSPTRRLGPRYRFAYAVMKAAGRFHGLKIYGRHHLDQPVGVIIAPNHVSNWDPPMLGAALGNMGAVRSVAKEELFRNPLSRAFYTFLDAVPIKRSIYDKAAFDRAARFLRSGSNILFFPEGMRRVFGSPGPVRNGLGMIMQRTGAPAVPVWFRGTIEPLPGGNPRAPLEVWFAPPVRLFALPALLREIDEREVNRRVARLFEAIYREMQERSFARNPMTDRERELAAAQVERVRRKEERTFGERRRRREAEAAT